MFAIIKTGGKQYRLAKGAKLLVEKLEGEVGKEIQFTDVLMVGDDKGTEIGTPFIQNAEVVAKVIDQIKDKKVIIFKKKRRQNYRRKKGHRQLKTVIEILDIKKDGKSVAPATAKKPAPAKKEETKPSAEKKEAVQKTSATETSSDAPKKTVKKAAPKTAAKKTTK
jgi:large subunit ribosomal protein L21